MLETCLSNILQMPITIFTSAQNMHLICILPTTSTLVSTHPICLVYTQDSEKCPGHYDYVCYQEESVEESSPPVETKQNKLKCTCGRKRDCDSATVCSSIRCPCFREETTCSKACTCKHCNNQFGKRPSTTSTRRRQSYDEQKQQIRGKPSCEFMIEIGEAVVDGYLFLEVLLIKVIIIYSIIKGIEASPDNVFTSIVLFAVLPMSAH